MTPTNQPAAHDGLDLFDPGQLAPISKLTKDLRAAAKTLTHQEARYLVSSYYRMQDDRIRADHQIRQLGDKPHDTLAWLGRQSALLENELHKALDAYTSAHRVGIWAKSIKGIGPIISAGLLAHINMDRAPTVGHIWRYAGLDPTQRWLGSTKSEALCKSLEKSGVPVEEAIAKVAEAMGCRPDTVRMFATTDSKGRPVKLSWESLSAAGAKRPWNDKLKRLCWITGECFVKVSRYDDAYYGKVYKERKEFEVANNEAGKNAEQAAYALANKRYGKDTDAYKAYAAGKLPDARIHLRATRYAVKLFLAHWHHVAYLDWFGEQPPKPYIIEHGGHTHFIEPPNLDVVGF